MDDRYGRIPAGNRMDRILPDLPGWFYGPVKEVKNGNYRYHPCSECDSRRFDSKDIHSAERQSKYLLTVDKRA